MGRIKPLVFGHGLEYAVRMLRIGGLLYENQFPELITPIAVDSSVGKGKKGITCRFIVKIGIRDNFNPNEIWLRFNRKGNSIWISADKSEWICLNKLKINLGERISRK